MFPPPWTPRRAPHHRHLPRRPFSRNTGHFLCPRISRLLSHLSLPLLFVFLSFACVYPSMYRRIYLPPSLWNGNVIFRSNWRYSLTVATSPFSLFPPSPSAERDETRWRSHPTLLSDFADLPRALFTSNFVAQVIRMELNAISRAKRTFYNPKRSLLFFFSPPRRYRSAHTPLVSAFTRNCCTLSAYNPPIVSTRHHWVSWKMLSLFPTCSM